MPRPEPTRKVSQSFARERKTANTEIDATWAAAATRAAIQSVVWNVLRDDKTRGRSPQLPRLDWSKLLFDEAGITLATAASASAQLAASKRQIIVGQTVLDSRRRVPGSRPSVRRRSTSVRPSVGRRPALSLCLYACSASAFRRLSVLSNCRRRSYFCRTDGRHSAVLGLSHRQLRSAEKGTLI